MQNAPACHLLFLAHMIPFIFGLLDLRRGIHLAVVAGCVTAIQACGPAELQAPVNRFIVAPLAQSATRLQQPLDYGTAGLRAIGRQLGWRS